MKEVEKMVAAQDEARTLGSFLDWLEDGNYAICEFREVQEENPAEAFLAAAGMAEDLPPYIVERWVIKRKSHEQLLADFFDIDLDKVEEERRAILEGLQDG